MTAPRCSLGSYVNEYALSSVYPITVTGQANAAPVLGAIGAKSVDELAELAFTATATDGTKMFVVGTQGDDVNEYALSAAFDASTAVFVDAFSVSSQETSPTGMAF